MKFGSEEDFWTATTELKWIKKIRGKVTKQDFERVSSKYNFPPSFLKEQLSGLVFPDDYKISQSKWFPIIYSWHIQSKEMSRKLAYLHINYLSSRFSAFRNIAFFIGIFQVAALYLYTNFGLDFTNLMLLIISFLLFLFKIFLQMRESVQVKRLALDEYRHFLKQKGLDKIIENDENLVKSHYKPIVYAGSIMKKKLETGLSISMFSHDFKDGIMYIKDWENPETEYRKRIEELGNSINRNNENG